MNTYFLTAVLLAATVPPFEVQTLDGRTITGPIVEISPAKPDGGQPCYRVTIDTDAGAISLSTDKLLQLSLVEKPAKRPEVSAVRVELLDGSSVAADDYTVGGDRFTLVLPNNHIVDLPVATVSAVRVQPHAATLVDQWSRILAMQLDADVLVVCNGDVLNYHSGVLHDVTDKVVRFELDGEVLPIKRSKVYGLIYRRAADKSLPEPICELTDATGSRWSVRSLALTDEGDIRLSTPCGATVVCRLSQVVQIDFSRGKVIYLSDLAPQSVEFVPFFGRGGAMPLLGRFFAIRNDVNLESAPLRLGGVQYSKGLAMHSRTKVVYRLPGRFSRFKAVAGIDDGVRPHGNLRLVISGDERVLLDTVLTGADPPVPIDLDVIGVRRIAVLVDFASELDVADHLDLCNARVIK